MRVFLAVLLRIVAAFCIAAAVLTSGLMLLAAVLYLVAEDGAPSASVREYGVPPAVGAHPLRPCGFEPVIRAPIALA